MCVHTRTTLGKRDDVCLVWCAGQRGQLSGALRASSSSLLKHFLLSGFLLLFCFLEIVSCSPGRIHIPCVPEDDPDHLIFLPLPTEDPQFTPAEECSHGPLHLSR